jgi:hypothetical protein
VPKLDTFGILKEKINKIENRFYKTKIITALHDLNSCNKLEVKLNSLNKSLKKLRNNRNTLLNTQNKKKYYLLNQLINISEDIKNSINNTYGKNLLLVEKILLII